MLGFSFINKEAGAPVGATGLGALVSLRVSSCLFHRVSDGSVVAAAVGCTSCLFASLCLT